MSLFCNFSKFLNLDNLTETNFRSFETTFVRFVCVRLFAEINDLGLVKCMVLIPPNEAVSEIISGVPGTDQSKLDKTTSSAINSFIKQFNKYPD